MVVLGGGAVSYERGTPASSFNQCCFHPVASASWHVPFDFYLILREFLDDQTSMITAEDPLRDSLRGLLFYSDLDFSHTLHVLAEMRWSCEHPHRLILIVTI